MLGARWIVAALLLAGAGHGAAAPPAPCGGQGLTPSADALSPLQYGLALHNVPAAWSVTTGSPEQVLAVLDTGADLTHADLVAARWPGNLWSGGSVAQPIGFYAELPVGAQSTTLDEIGHGTAVAGVAVATCGNGAGIAGVAQVPLLVVKTQGIGAPLTPGSAAAGLDMAVAYGARVVVMSFTFSSEPAELARAVADAAAADVVLVAAAGNDNATRPRWPAAFPEVIGVGAVDAEGRRAPFSSRGHVDLVAAGVDVPTLARGNAYQIADGTSLAAPFVAGVAALVRSADPTLTRAEVHAILNATARDVGAPGFDPETGWGLVDAGAAIAAALE